MLVPSFILIWADNSFQYLSFTCLASLYLPSLIRYLMFSFQFVYYIFSYLLQAHAASAVLNFTENCTPDILTPYLDGIVSKLLVLLQVWAVSICGFLSTCILLFSDD